MIRGYEVETAQTLYSDPYEMLKANPLPEMSAKDRELYSADMSKDDLKRIQTRAAWRSKYGEPHLIQSGQPWSDEEVDESIRITYDLKPENTIDYFKISDDIERYNKILSPDQEDFTIGEFASATAGNIIQGVDNFVTEAGTLGIDVFYRAGEVQSFSPSFNVSGFSVDPNLYRSKDQVLQLDKERAIPGYFKYTRIKTMADFQRSIDFVPKGIRTDMNEQMALMSDDNVNWFAKSINAVSQNSPYLLAAMSNPAVGFFAMYSGEKGTGNPYTGTLSNFRELAGAPLNPQTRDELDRFALANEYASRYGAASGLVEYAQNRNFLKLLGIKAPAAQRQLRASAAQILKPAGISTLENIGEEVIQGIIYNAVMNDFAAELKELYPDDAKIQDYQPVSLFDDIGESAKGALMLSTILVPFGTVRNVNQAKTYIKQKTAEFQEMGFSEKDAKAYAKRMAITSSDPEAFEETANKINEDFNRMELAQSAKIREEKAARVYDETGLIRDPKTNTLSDQDFDRLAVQYTRPEVEDLIAKTEYKELFANAVFGSTKDRIKYNEIIESTYKFDEQKGGADEEEVDQTTTTPDPQVEVIDEETLEQSDLDDLEDLDEGARNFARDVLLGLEDKNIGISQDATDEQKKELRKAEVAKIKSSVLGDAETETDIDTDVETEVDPDVVDYEAEYPKFADLRTYARTRNIVGRSRADITAKLNREDAIVVGEKETKEIAVSYSNIDVLPAVYQTSKMKRLGAFIDNTGKSLQEVAPNTKIIFAKSAQNFESITGVVANGFYNPQTQTIYLNPETATQGTVVHEVVHAIFHQKFKTDARIRVATDKIFNEMLIDTLDENLKTRIGEWQKNYSNKEDLNEEAIAELASMIADGYVVLTPNNKRSIKDWLFRIFKGYFPLKTDAQAVKLLKVLGDKVTKGEQILNQDLELLDQIGRSIDTNESISTEYQNGKLQSAWSDVDTKLTYRYDFLDDKDLSDMVKLGRVTKSKSLSNFQGMSMAVHSPDAAFSGSIEYQGITLVKGKGGIFYPLLFGDKGMMWASTKGTAAQTVNRVNESFEQNGGVAYLALTSAPRDKALSSTNGAEGAFQLFQSLANRTDFGITPNEFNQAVQKASKELGLNTSDPSQIKEKLGPDNSIFSQRKAFVEALIINLSNESSEKGKESLRKLYDSVRIYPTELKPNPKSAKQLELGSAGIRAFSEMLAEPLLKNAIEGEEALDREAGGQVYAVIEVRSRVGSIASTDHESYPFSVVTEDGSAPILHILNDRINQRAAFITTKDMYNKKGELIIGKDKPIRTQDEEQVSIGGFGLAFAPLRVGIDRKLSRQEVLRKAGKKKKKIKIATFFSGIGTVEIALTSKDGVQVLYTAEIDQDVIEEYNATHDAKQIATDILKLNPEDLKGVEFFHMSPPCQSFAPPKAGRVDSKQLELEMKIAEKIAEIITVVKPKNLTIENAPKYIDSPQFAVIKNALEKAGYLIEAGVYDSQYYGGNSMRKRMIARATLTKGFPPLPAQTGPGNWYESMKEFIRVAPTEPQSHIVSSRGRKKTEPFDEDFNEYISNIADLLYKIQSKQFDPDVPYISPQTGDGRYKPLGEAGRSLTANKVYKPKADGSPQGSSAIMRVALPVRTLVEQKGKRFVAEYYGTTLKDIDEALEGTGFVFKRGTKEMLLAYMNLPTETPMPKDVAMARQMIGNGINGVITKGFIEPMIGKKQLSDDYIQRKLAEYRSELKDNIETAQSKYDGMSMAELRAIASPQGIKGRAKADIIEQLALLDEEVREETEGYQDEDRTDSSYYESEEFENPREAYREYYDEAVLYDDEASANPDITLLTIKEIQRIFNNLGLAELSLPKAKRLFTLIADAKKDVTPELLKQMAVDVLENGKILTAKEHAMVLLRVTQIKNENEEMRDAIESGAYPGNVDLSEAYEANLAELNEILQADAISGSETGRALGARRIALNEDYSIAGVIRRAQNAAKRELNKEELEALNVEVESLNEVNRKLQARITELDMLVVEEDRKAAEEWLRTVKKQRPKKPKKRTSSVKDDTMPGKAQLYTIDRTTAIDIQVEAKELVFSGYDNLYDIVEELQNEYTDVPLYDIYGAISGRIQRVKQTQSEASKRLKRLKYQAKLEGEVIDAMDGIFAPGVVRKPPSAEIQALREQLKELKAVARQNAQDDATVQRTLDKIRDIDLMLEGLYRPVRKQTKARSESVEQAYDQLFTKRAELRAQDRLILLQTILDYGNPPKFKNTKRHPESAKLESMRAQISILEEEIKDRNKKEADKRREQRRQEQINQTLVDLTNQVEGWYRKNVPPVKAKPLSSKQQEIKNQRQLLRQQDQIVELMEILRTGKLPDKPRAKIKDRKGYRVAIANLKQELRDQEWYQQIQQEKWEQKRKQELQVKIDEQQKILTEGDFSGFLKPKEQKNINDPELLQLMTVQRAGQRRIRRAINELRPKNKLQEIAEWAGLPRAFMATADMSAVFRQAFMLGVAYPKDFAKAIKISAKAMIDPQFAAETMTILENDNMSLIREEAGLFFSSLDTALTTSEEAFSSKALEKIYGLGGPGKAIQTVMTASERHMVIMLNHMRAAAFDSFVEANPQADAAERKVMAHYINTASGRGDLNTRIGSFEGAAQALSAVMFSPRFAVSRFMVAPEAIGVVSKAKLKGENEAAAKEITRQWGSLVLTNGLIMTLAILAGAKVGDDPEESDFGLIIFGRTRIDMYAGMGPPMRLLAKWLDSGYKRITGEEVDVDLGTQTLNTLVKYKASPWISGGIELFTGKRYVSREDIPAWRVIGERAIPISLSNFIQNLQDESTGGEIAAELSGEFVGISIYTRNKKKRKKKRVGSTL